MRSYLRQSKHALFAQSAKLRETNADVDHIVRLDRGRAGVDDFSESDEEGTEIGAVVKSSKSDRDKGALL